ncbi:MAG TPA: DUF4328 domain-containing protein [Pyrinomonadaceae bacterium]|nr:DUF4328 domain-containing protein [Pyrinomonadaceae bacterium]
MAGVGLVGVIELLAALVGLIQILDPARAIHLDDGSSFSLWLMLQSLIAVVSLATFLPAIVLFLVWLHRTYTNLPALRSDSTEFTAGWAIGWWFIPFANLVKPYQVVRNVWAESDPDLELESGFLTSVQAGAPGFMMVWWAFWILSNIASNITGNLFDPTDMRTVVLSGYLFIAAGILRAIASVFAIKVIHAITTRQEQRFARLGHGGIGADHSVNWS